jgi:two-component system, cell cycle sensor histidine kinase and response regulator CckA
MERGLLRALLAEGGFAALGHDNTDAVYAFDLDGRFIDANGELFTRLGYSREQMEDRPFGGSVAAEDLDTALASFESAAQGRMSTWSTTIHSSSDQPIPVTVVNLPFYAGGEIVAVLGIARDLHQLERSRRRAEDLEHQLETMLDSLPDTVLLVDQNWMITFANSPAHATVSAAGRSLVGLSFWEGFADSDEFEADYRAAMAGESPPRRRGFAPALDLWVEITVFPTSTGIAVFARDIDAMHRARLEREAIERRAVTQAALLDAASDAMIVRRLDGTISYWNRAAADLYGWSEGEAMNVSARDLLFDDPQEFDTAFASTLDDGSWFGTVHQHGKDGRRIVVDSRWTLIRNADGEPESVFSISSDVTEKHNDELVRLRAQRLESLGTLAGGIAHDLNNVLTPILMTTQLLAESQPDAASRNLLEAAERSARRGADLIQQVLTFAVGDSGPQVDIDVSSLLGDLEQFCRQTLPRTIDIQFDTPGAAQTVHGDATQLTQVLMNVVVNARDAMPDGGVLRVSVSERGSTAQQDASVLITISDNGTGMDRATMDSIFEPFFTTKPRGSGTGLGLATSLSIVRQHGGTMTVTSEVGEGSTFSIELPVIDASTASRVTDDTAAIGRGPRGCGELVLVVEDETEIRRITCLVLEAAGFTTVSAENGAQGLAAYAQHSDTVALVLTDLNMPELGGSEMGTQLRALGFTGPILAASGGAGPDTELLDGFATAFIAKPYSSHELVTAVAALLCA